MMLKFFIKYHKWFGIILAYFLLTFVVSGIILNHRETLSSIDISRRLLPKMYRYNNWNNAAVKSTLRLSNDSVLIYGNIGAWLTDNDFSKFKDFNTGFPKGIDNRKISKMLITPDGQLIAGTYFGLFEFSNNQWHAIKLSVEENRITDIITKQDTVIVLTRSHLLKTTDLKDFIAMQLPPPVGYDNTIGLFKTLWVIHSGEIYGTFGKLLVDFIALVFGFLTITGLIVFIKKSNIKKYKGQDPKKLKLRSSIHWNINWHNKLGWTTAILLLITVTTGVFLRPPLLAAIFNTNVKKIPFTELDTPNPWYDLLRGIYYDKDNHEYIVATMNGFYHSDNNFQSDLVSFEVQPPVSVMGVNVLQKYAENTYMVGSFEGLFLWNPTNGFIYDYIKKTPYIPTNSSIPIGDYLVTGYSNDFKGHEIFFDYDFGSANMSNNKPFPKMPQKIIDNSPISLWSASLEFHTGRIYQSLIGNFYILVVPLVGLSGLFILISGFIVWYKVYRKK